MPTRNASAKWEGGLKGGRGSFSGETGIGGQFTFGSRFENAAGSNPEELLAASLAACYSMALSGALEKNGTTATSIETKAACTLERVNDAPTVTKIDLDVRAVVPNVDDATFQRLAAETAKGCPIARALSSVKIPVKATLAT
ncbi:MAG: OsmC family peroxiredoxin [Gemmatimonadaceae bacterium]